MQKNITMKFLFPHNYQIKILNIKKKISQNSSSIKIDFNDFNLKFK